MTEHVLKAIEQANEEESKLYVEAALARREAFLEGGEILYREFSREMVEHRQWLMEELQRIQEEETEDGTKT